MEYFQNDLIREREQLAEELVEMLDIIETAKELHANDITDHTQSEYIREGLLNANYRKRRTGEWLVSENGCVINCSICGYRLELCYPDGTEVTFLPHCPKCAAAMIGSNIDIKLEEKND